MAHGKSTKAVFVPSYGIALRDPSRLVEMSCEATVEGARVLKENDADVIILAAAFEEYWRTEAELRIAILDRAGVDSGRIRILPAVTSTYDEAKKMRALIEEFDITTLLVVGNEWQVPRAALAFSYFFPDLRVQTEPVRTTVVEPIVAPSWLRTLPTRNRQLWIAHNLTRWVVAQNRPKMVRTRPLG